MRRRRSRNVRDRIAGGKGSLLKMTSLMDIFTTLLLFLLKSFVAEGHSSSVAPGVVLPPSLSSAAPWDAPVITVTSAHVAIEDRVVPAQVALAGTDLLIEPLHATLVELHGRGETVPGFLPRLVVQGDRGIEFRLLQRVIYTGQLAGFTQVSLAVLQDESALAHVGTPTP